MNLNETIMTTAKKKRNVIICGTYLPVFGGLYGNIYEDKMEVDEAIEHINTEYNKSIGYDDLVIDYQGANLSISKKIFNIVTGELERMNLINGSEFEKFVSPREYNFTNDSIDCTLKFSKENVDNIKKYIVDNSKEWEEYLKERFTSRSGFSSFYENKPDGADWSDIRECLKDKTKCGVVLDFILLNEGFDENEVYCKLEFYMGEHITNYLDLIGE